MRSKRERKQRFNAREPKLKIRGRKEEYTMERKNAWAAYAQDDSKVEAFAKAYRDFIDNGKTERECVDYAVKKVKTDGKPKYVIFFKARDADALTQAFTEYSRKTVEKEKKLSVLKKLRDLSAVVMGKVLERTRGNSGGSRDEKQVSKTFDRKHSVCFHRADCNKTRANMETCRRNYSQ